MSKPAPAPRLQDRIKELRRVPGSELRANPLNFRTHPESQRSALAGVLEEVGIAAALIARETPEGLLLIDGHLRAEDYGDVEWPVLILDVTESEAELLLATLDPIAAMAGMDATTAQNLISRLNSPENQGALNDLIGSLQSQADHELLRELAKTENSREASYHAYANYTVPLTPEQDKLVRRCVFRAKEKHGLESSGDALAAVCREWLGDG